MIPKTLPLNRLTVGKHTQTVALQDTAGSVLKYTNTFVVTTSFADLDTVLTQYANNALQHDAERRARRSARPAVRLQTPFGFRAGQTLVLDTGDNQETVTIARQLIPPPTHNTTLSAAAAAGATAVRLASYTTATTGGPNAPTVNGPIALQPIVLDTGANQEVIAVKTTSHRRRCPAARRQPNVILTAPLAKDHAAGTATSLANVLLSSPLTKAHATGSAAVEPAAVRRPGGGREPEGAARAGDGRGRRPATPRPRSPRCSSSTRRCSSRSSRPARRRLSGPR